MHRCPAPLGNVGEALGTVRPEGRRRHVHCIQPSGCSCAMWASKLSRSADQVDRSSGVAVDSRCARHCGSKSVRPIRSNRCWTARVTSEAVARSPSSAPRSAVNTVCRVALSGPSAPLQRSQNRLASPSGAPVRRPTSSYPVRPPVACRRSGELGLSLVTGGLVSVQLMERYLADAADS